MTRGTKHAPALRALATMVLAVAAGALCGCANRVMIVTGTTVGLRASPGDGAARPPEVALAYKRAETAFVPTAAKTVTKDGGDAYSTLAVFALRTEWFSETRISSLIATGHAAREIQGESGVDEFNKAFAQPTLVVPPAEIAARQKALIDRLAALATRDAANLEKQALKILTASGLSKVANKSAAESLQDRITETKDVATLERLESTFELVEQ